MEEEVEEEVEVEEEKEEEFLLFLLRSLSSVKPSLCRQRQLTLVRTVIPWAITLRRKDERQRTRKKQQTQDKSQCKTTQHANHNSALLNLVCVVSAS